MSDHILYKEETLSTAAAELERLASTMSVVTRQLDAVDTSDEWWEHIKGVGGESAVDRVRALRRTCDELDKQSARLAGNVRRAIDLYEQAETKAARLCQIDGPAGQPPYLDETGAVAGGGASGDDEGPLSWLGDALGEYGTVLGPFLEWLEKVGFIGEGFWGGLTELGEITSILSSFLTNLNELISSDGAMSVGRALSEFVLELVVDYGAGELIGDVVGWVAGVLCPVAAPVVVWAVSEGVEMLYEMTIGDDVAEKVSDFFLNKAEERRQEQERQWEEMQEWQRKRQWSDMPPAPISPEIIL